MPAAPAQAAQRAAPAIPAQADFFAALAISSEAEQAYSKGEDSSNESGSPEFTCERFRRPRRGEDVYRDNVRLTSCALASGRIVMKKTWLAGK